uniref:WGS project CBMI000000000 data, contig CS3069_c002044 n=1 Tax=Fusarium clavum TaxID=2594811 RepID=A0A090N5M1_9HYPO|nr:unnamed protein product [Fusarium clavum]
MIKAFDDGEKALMAEKQFSHKVVRKMKTFTLEDFEYYSMYTFFNDFVILIPGADTPCVIHNFERMKNFAREQSSVYNLLPDLTKGVNGRLTESGRVFYDKNWLGI